MLPDLPPRVEAVTGRVVAVAQASPGTAAVALVGSWARGAGRADSDVDIVLLSDQPGCWLDREDWIDDIARGAVLTSARDFGAIQERRLRLPSGLEIELGIGSPAWASVTPLDDGTRRVADDGLQALWDPSGLLHVLLAAIRHEPRCSS